jgi:hypothetical protein
MGNQDVDVFKRGELESKIVFLVQGHSANAQLQYNETWRTSLSVVKVNYYGNQSGLQIREILLMMHTPTASYLPYVFY